MLFVESPGTNFVVFAHVLLFLFQFGPKLQKSSKLLFDCYCLRVPLDWPGDHRAWVINKGYETTLKEKN